jgi:serine/threonine-protein kinase RsbW
VSTALPTAAPPPAQATRPTHFFLRYLADLPPCLDAVAEELAGHGFPAADIFAVRLALQEAVVNAIKHGHGHDPRMVVRTRCRVTDDQVLAEVEDEGTGFDPTEVSDPTAPENLGEPGGRGLFLMRQCMTWVRYNSQGNCVTLCKRRSPAESPS